MMLSWLIVEILGFASVLIWRVHLMSILVGLEIISLGLVWGLVMNFSFVGASFVFIYFVILSVCEAVLGIMLLVYFIRASGWDGCMMLGVIF